MRFGDWLYEQEEDFDTPDVLDLISKKKFKEIVKKALAIDDPPSKFDDNFKLLSLDEIDDNIKMLKTALNILKGEVNTESDEEKKEWKIATYQDIKDSHDKWEAYEKERTSEFEPPEEGGEETPPEEGGEETPPEEEKKE